MPRTTTSGNVSQSVPAGTLVGAPVSLPDANGVSLSTAYGLTAVARVLNGATGPTVGAFVQVMVKHGAQWRPQGYPVQAGLTSSFEYVWPLEFGHDAPSAVRVDFYGNTGQPVTASLDYTRTDTV